MDALRHTEGWTLLITNGAYELANIPLPGFVIKYEEKRIQVDVHEDDLNRAVKPQSAKVNVQVDLSKEVSTRLDDLRAAFETHKAECTGHVQCASVNCDRPARLQNKVQGRLQLNSEGRAIWVEAYLCDVCMQFVREGQERNTSVGSTAKACYCLGGQAEVCAGCLSKLAWR